MKIGWIRYPQVLYRTGQVIKGGSEIANQYIIDYLRSKKIDVAEFEPSSSGRIDLIKIPAVGTPLMFQDLLNRIDEINGCDLVFTTNWFGSILPEIKKPIITIFHHDSQLALRFSYYDVVENKAVFDKWMNELKKFSLGARNHQTLHDQVISIDENYLAHHSKKNIAVSNFLKKCLVDDYSLNEKMITTIYNSFTPDWRIASEKVIKNFKDPKLKLICVTRLPVDEAGLIIKGSDRLFETFSKDLGLDKTILATTKPGVYGNFFKTSLEGVHYIENADREMVKKALAESHISLHPSRCESFGLSVVESMLMGNVPIAFPTGVVEEFIENGKNGFIVNSIEEVLKVIENLTRDRKLLKDISRHARESVLKKMSPDLIGEQYLKIIQEVI